MQSDFVDLAFKQWFKLHKSDCKKFGSQFTVCANYAELYVVYLYLSAALYENIAPYVELSILELIEHMLKILSIFDHSIKFLWHQYRNAFASAHGTLSVSNNITQII